MAGFGLFTLTRRPKVREVLALKMRKQAKKYEHYPFIHTKRANAHAADTRHCNDSKDAP